MLFSCPGFIILTALPAPWRWKLVRPISFFTATTSCMVSRVSCSTARFGLSVTAGVLFFSPPPLILFFPLAAIGLFYILLRRISGERFCSLIFSLFAAVSFGYWFWAGEAQVYPLSYVPLVAIFYLGVTRKVSAHPYAVALLHMWAVAGHVLHVIFAAVILYFIASESA